MGIDWEDTLGDTSYEDAVDIAVKSLESLKQEEEAIEQDEMQGQKDTVSTQILPEQGSHRVVVPTLFKFEKVEIKSDDCVKAKLTRIYDKNIRDKYMKKGYVYNALLPYSVKSANIPYAYQGDKDMQFLLPNKPNNRMLFLRLIGEDSEVAGYRDKSFAKVVFWPEVKGASASSKKGEVEFGMGIEAYEGLEDLSLNHYLILEDHTTCKKFAFECWVEQLPVPGKDEGIYAYVDGSAGDTDRPEDFGSGCVVTIDKKVYLAHCEETDSGRNVSAEYLAATKVFKYFPKDVKNLKELYIYYDNNNVGYVPAGLYKPGTKYAHDYLEAIETFEKENPDTILKFIHTDGHSGIAGNEMADQMAERKKKKLDKLLPGFQENRGKLCPGDGSYSTALTGVFQ